MGGTAKLQPEFLYPAGSCVSCRSLLRYLNFHESEEMKAYQQSGLLLQILSREQITVKLSSGKPTWRLACQLTHHHTTALEIFKKRADVALSNVV